MTLAHGRPYLAIPGPSVMPDRVLNAMHVAAPNIYEGALVETVAGLIPDLQAVARTEGDVAIYICNGHGAWEAAASNMIRPGEKVLVLSTGRFAAGWGEVFARLGAEVETDRFRQARADRPGPGRGRAQGRHRARDQGGRRPSMSIPRPGCATTSPACAR